MIHAELAGKLTEDSASACLDRWEDVLTSSVFGLLRYLPPAVLRRFLAQASIRVVGARKRLALDPDEDIHFEVTFWPVPPGWHREPDVIIDARTESGTLLRRIVVEAKYGSGKSQGASRQESTAVSEPRRAGDQLADQLLLAIDDHNEGRMPATFPPAVIYLTAHYLEPVEELNESFKVVQARRGPAQPDIYWLPWWKLSAALRTQPPSNAREALIAADLVALLDRRGQFLFDSSWNSAPPVLHEPGWSFEVTKLPYLAPWVPLPHLATGWRFNESAFDWPRAEFIPARPWRFDP